MRRVHKLAIMGSETRRLALYPTHWQLRYRTSLLNTWENVDSGKQAIEKTHYQSRFIVIVSGKEIRRLTTCLGRNPRIRFTRLDETAHG